MLQLPRGICNSRLSNFFFTKSVGMYESDPMLYTRLHCYEVSFSVLFLLYDHQDQHQDLMGKGTGGSGCLRQQLYLSEWAEADRLAFQTSKSFGCKPAEGKLCCEFSGNAVSQVESFHPRHNTYRKAEWQLQALCWPGLSKSFQFLWHAVGDPMATTSHSPWKHAGFLTRSSQHHTHQAYCCVSPVTSSGLLTQPIFMESSPGKAKMNGNTIIHLS